ncbi:MAG: helix-turn-helix domain-containing protein [Bacilli bacterium]
MSLGQRLLDLRKSKHLSQEEASEKLNVTRQTISKWETDQSTPDFDKIIPLCKLYGITSDELLTGKKEIEKKESEDNEKDFNKKRARGIAISVLLYFISLIWIMISIPVLEINPVVATAVFLLIIGLATYYIVYISITYNKKAKDKKENKLIKKIDNILLLLTLVIYLSVSFITMAWHITWLLWLVYALILKIIKLIFSLKGECDEEE